MRSLGLTKAQYNDRRARLARERYWADPEFRKRTLKQNTKWRNKNRKSKYQLSRMAKWQRIYRLRDYNKIRNSARMQASYAIRKGIIVRGICQICGETKTEAHHDDYSKPLEVRWLCKKHHEQIHHQQRILS